MQVEFRAMGGRVSMKLWKRMIIFVLCIAMAVPTFGVLRSQAAGENGLTEKNGKYFYYENGKKVKGRLQTVTAKNGKKYYYYFKSSNGAAVTGRLKKVTTSGGKTFYYYFKDNGRAVTGKWKRINGYRYYFKSNGRAYQAESIYGRTYNVTVKTINGKKYGFDTKARAANGIYLRMKDSKLLFFDKDGSYNAKVSRTFQRNLPDYDGDAAPLLALLRQYEGAAKKTEVHQDDDVASCFGCDAGDQCIFYTFAHLEIITVKRAGSSVESFRQIDTL